MMLKAFLLGCIAFLGKCDLATGTNQLQRPIILGPLVGLVLGDLDAGIKIGATLELAFLGSYSVGAFIPPNVIVGGVLGTAFAIVTGKGPAVAFTMAFPIALLAVAIDNVFFSLVRPLLGKVADNYAEKGNVHMVSVIHMSTGFLTCTVLFLMVFLGFSVGSDAMKKFVEAIPAVITNGLTIATGLLPGIGFAMLAQMIMNKKVVPFFFLGFVLSAYFKLPVVGIALLGLIIIFTTIDFTAKKTQLATDVVEEDDDDDF